MSESARVWVIEQGDYSDYRVVGVFSSRENAERIAAKINAVSRYEEATVAEWPLDPGVDALNQGLEKYTVHMLRDGSVEMQRKTDGWGGTDLESSFDIWERTKAPAYQGKGVPDVIAASVWARDDAHAVKITNEVRLQKIASGEW